jgi:hypothetical protein
LDEAKAHGFHIFELTLDLVCELHAARELYSDAQPCSASIIFVPQGQQREGAATGMFCCG